VKPRKPPFVTKPFAATIKLMVDGMLYEREYVLGTLQLHTLMKWWEEKYEEFIILGQVEVIVTPDE